MLWLQITWILGIHYQILAVMLHESHSTVNNSVTTSSKSFDSKKDKVSHNTLHSMNDGPSRPCTSSANVNWPKVDPVDNPSVKTVIKDDGFQMPSFRLKQQKRRKKTERRGISSFMRVEKDD